MKANISERRHDLDWLRVLVILAVFVFHCGRFFDTGNWHVKNATRHEAVAIWKTASPSGYADDFLRLWHQHVVRAQELASRSFRQNTRVATAGPASRWRLHLSVTRRNGDDVVFPCFAPYQ